MRMRRLAALWALSLALSALPLGLAEPTPGVSANPMRIVPEAWETNDYVSYEEARGYLAAIVEAAPDYVEVVEVGESFGWPNVAGGHDSFPVFAVEVTHEASPVPREQKKVLVFQLSIHGNEKGGREGGFRVIEDLVVPRLYGEQYRALLDETLVVFTFPNPDGWRHEEVPYQHNCPGDGPDVGVCGFGPFMKQGFVRTNGNWQDLNRDWPTQGWYRTEFGRENALSEPEIAALQAYLAQFRGRVLAASDIHGMLTPADGGITAAGSLPVPFLGGDGGNGPRSMCLPQNPAGVECVAKEGHFVLGMVRGYGADAANMLRDVQLSEATKEALQAMADARFPYWGALPNMGVAGGRFMEYGTVWDTLGYSDSGFTGLWFAQALGASGVDYELSYNHVTFDNHYVPEVNAIHVESVRTIVRAYLDNAAAGLVPALRPAGAIAWLDDPRTVRSVPAAQQEGAHRGADADDAYEAQVEVSPMRFWRDLARYAPAGSIAPIAAADLAAGRLAAGTLVISDAAWDLVEADPAALRALQAWVEGGGKLVLTDSALRGLEALGVAREGSVERGVAYMGYVDLDFDHALAEGVRPLAHQTFEGVPLGFGLDEDASPIWTVAADALVEGANVVGTSLAPERASVGLAVHGRGAVLFLGALLPTPNTDVYHPYGLADYAVSATGYQLVYNMLGIAVEAVEGGAATQAPAGSGPQAPAQRIPGFEGLAAALALGAALAVARRRA